MAVVSRHPAVGAANANSDSLLKIYGRNMMLASERADANCAFSAASIGRAPLYPRSRNGGDAAYAMMMTMIISRAG